MYAFIFSIILSFNTLKSLADSVLYFIIFLCRTSKGKSFRLSSQTITTSLPKAKAYPSSYQTFGLSTDISAKHIFAFLILDSISSIGILTIGSKSTLYANNPTDSIAGL